MDPSWLCRDVLGTALAPGEFSTPNLTNQVGKSVITSEDLTKLLGAQADLHLNSLVQILTSFDLCYELRGTDPVAYNFPCFIKMTLEPEDWRANPGYAFYHGRRIQCSEELDFFPTGLFNRFQVKVCNMYNEIQLFKDALIVKEKNAFCLVKTDDTNSQITFIARASIENHSGHQKQLFSNPHNCFLLLDILHQQLFKLLKVACPNVSMKWNVLSPIDIKAHKEQPYVYKCEEVVNAIHSNAPFVNKDINQVEKMVDVLYCGSTEVEKEQSRENLPIAFLPDAVFQKLEDLLGDTNVQISNKEMQKVCV